MGLNVIKEFYLQVRNSLVGLLVFFVLQGLILIALSVLIFLYPESLTILFGVFFGALALVSLYVAIMIARYTFKLKKLKEDIFNITKLFK